MRIRDISFKKNIVYLQFFILLISIFSFSFTSSKITISYTSPGVNPATTTARTQIPTTGANTGGSVATSSLVTSQNLVTKQALTYTAADNTITSIPAGTSITTSSSGAGTFVSGGETLTIPADAMTAATEAGQIGAPISKNMVSGFLRLGAGGIADAAVTGLQWAVVAYMAGQLLGPMLGLGDEQTDSLSMSLAAGFGVYEGLTTYTAGGTIAPMSSLAATGWGVVIAAVVLVATYEDTKTETVTFTCQPWQAPNGGNNCELCNDNDLPCSEYRCKSLGQSCELVNEGTEDEKCVHVNPHDVTPPVIKPNYDAWGRTKVIV